MFTGISVGAFQIERRSILGKEAALSLHPRKGGGESVNARYLPERYIFS